MVDQRPTVAPRVRVQGFAAASEEAGGDPHPQAAQGPGAVALQGQDVLAGPADRLDPLAQGSQVRAALGLILATGPDHGRAQLGGVYLEVGPGVALVAEDGERAS